MWPSILKTNGQKDIMTLLACHIRKILEFSKILEFPKKTPWLWRILLQNTINAFKEGAGEAKQSKTRPKKGQSRLNGGGERIVKVKMAACTNPMGNVTVQGARSKIETKFDFFSFPVTNCANKTIINVNVY